MSGEEVQAMVAWLTAGWCLGFGLGYSINLVRLAADRAV